MDSLENLDLYETKVGSIEPLFELDALEEVNPMGTNVSRSQAKRLQEAPRDCCFLTSG